MDLRLIDAIGPFFRHHKTKRINWSKVPFAHLESGAGLCPEVLESVPDDFAAFCDSVAAIGYNAVSLDDAAHLIDCDGYEPDLRARIAAYRELYARLFAIAADRGLAVYLTMDVMFYNAALDRVLGESWQAAADWLGEQLPQLFTDFPQVAGLVMRFGEHDSLDTEGDFRSRLLLRHPRHARGFLQRLLPVFERCSRTLVFRTWSVGVHHIGDLIWNQRTFHQVFDRLDSPALIISMKYGESDFFRYLPINPLFFASDHKKIIEFQARREYEGFGAYPSFVGFDAERHLHALAKGNARNVVGMSVWCQTGGWGKLRRLTFIRNSSVWVELNCFVLARLAMNQTAEHAIVDWCDTNLPGAPSEKMIEFLRLSDEVIENLLYVREFAERRLFFRRLRLPPQMYVFWDRIIINHTVNRIMSCLVENPEAAVREGWVAMAALRRMSDLTERYDLPDYGLDFQRATFEILAVAREYFFRPFDAAVIERLEQLKTDYKATFKRSYSITMNFDRARVARTPLRWGLRVMLRRKQRYRMLDQVVTLRLLGWLYPLVAAPIRKVTPKFASNTAMGLDSLFK